MANPRSGMKISKKDGVIFENNIDHVMYTIEELIHSANRDVGKFITRAVKDELIKQYEPNYTKGKMIKPRTGKFLRSKAGKTVQYWARKQELDLLVGFKNHNWMTQQELGDSNYQRLGLLRNTVAKNVDMINKIQGQYLTALNKDKPNIPSGKDEGSGDD
ncbi:hypothetical protein [Helcococcus kunzii]|uniref:hypothetical protein n=1 Tax=Helcococcus kunzii TaxID=40091 RepID=UPI001BB03E64|nr:hypothetical protein [Helcococcus kunzii]QUY64291.1 hypothetical protein GUI37_01660 [Helcococcus kunzii]